MSYVERDALSKYTLPKRDRDGECVCRKQDKTSKLRLRLDYTGEVAYPERRRYLERREVKLAVQYDYAWR